jgi:hypothetical protein
MVLNVVSEDVFPGSKGFVGIPWNGREGEVSSVIYHIRYVVKAAIASINHAAPYHDQRGPLTTKRNISRTRLSRFLSRCRASS